MIILFPLMRLSAAPTPSRGSARRVVDQTDLPFGRTAALHDRWSTTAAVPGNYTTYKLEKETGFLMTAADPANLTVELEDCVSQWPGHRDHILEQVGVCESARYQRLRTAGRVYSYPQQRTGRFTAVTTHRINRISPRTKPTARNWAPWSGCLDMRLGQ